MGPSKPVNNIETIIKRGSHKPSTIDAVIPLVSGTKIKKQIFSCRSSFGAESTSLLMLHDDHRLGDKDDEPFESSTLLKKNKSSATSKMCYPQPEILKNGSSESSTSSMIKKSNNSTKAKFSDDKSSSLFKDFSTSLASMIPQIRRPRSKTEVSARISPMVSPPTYRSKSHSFNGSHTSNCSTLPKLKHADKLDTNEGSYDPDEDDNSDFEGDSLEQIEDVDVKHFEASSVTESQQQHKQNIAQRSKTTKDDKIVVERKPRKLPVTPTSRKDVSSPCMNEYKQSHNTKKEKSKGSPKNRLLRTFSLPSSPFSTRKNDTDGVEDIHKQALKRNAKSLRDRLRHSMHGRERAVSLPEHELFPEAREYMCYKNAVRHGRRGVVISLEFNQSVSLVKTDDRFLEFTFVPPCQLEYV